ncbi:MAG: signal peptidase I [Verrucomicrobia bacterium]|nr:signal peptidase I [Verrucomicrobiota bacterium]MBI3868517.1 signal peptidase I [Verrucomicrobiota bacterium]
MTNPGTNPSNLPDLPESRFAGSNTERTGLARPSVNGRTASGASRRRFFWRALLTDVQQRFPMLMGLFLCCVASYFLASRYMVCTVIIRGRSMTPTLRDGDQYLLNRIAYLFREPKRGDLIVLRDPGHTDMAIKRIVAGPGDCIEVKDGVVYVNHSRLAEHYLAPSTQTQPGKALSSGAVRLGDKSYFVLGDNRQESEDSRYYGPIHRDNIVGVVSL